MTGRKFKLFFPRWRFPYNLGDTVMLSSLFKAVRQVYQPGTLEVVADAVVAGLFAHDPWVDRFVTASWLTRKLIRKSAWSWYQRRGGHGIIWPHWQKAAFDHLAMGHNLVNTIQDPRRNILSINYAVQLGPEIVAFDDLRPRIHLTPEELARARQEIAPNAIALHVAAIRQDQSRLDNERLRYRRSAWQRFVQLVKAHDPSLVVYEVGQKQFEGIGDKLIPIGSIRDMAARLKATRLVVLSDGGVHNVCNAIDQPVLLFQGYEWNPPELFQMGNARFNPAYHPPCRQQCHLFEDILNLPKPRDHCHRACYDLSPERLAEDCIALLDKHPGHQA
ncbi:MAG: hypothetical protein HQL63_03985 [Magnetococcales bacterium]|nr:hypothetical protein [Magnetococcales bacterium]